MLTKLEKLLLPNLTMMEIDIKHGIKTVSYKNQGVDLEGDSSTSCDYRGQIKHFSFETLMQETVLDIDLNDRTV